MPIIKSAKKALRGSKRKQVFNANRTKVLRDVVKDIKKTIANKDAGQAKSDLARVYQAIDKAAKRGVIKKNTAARKKSRLVKMIKGIK